MKDCLSVSFFLGNCRFGREPRSFALEVEEETSLDHLSSEGEKGMFSLGQQEGLTGTYVRLSGLTR